MMRLETKTRIHSRGGSRLRGTPTCSISFLSYIIDRSRCGVSDQCHLVMHVKIGFGIVSLGNTNQVYSRVAYIRNIRRLFFSRNFFNEFVIRICIIFNSLRPFLREEFRETNLSNLHLILILITFVCLGNFECSSEYELVSMKFHTFICLSSVTIYLWPW